MKPQHDAHVQAGIDDYAEKWNRDMGSTQYHKLSGALNRGLD